MDGIKNFIFNLLVISLSCAALNFLAPENKKLSKYVQYIFALIITVILLSPLGSLLGKIPELSESINDYANSFEYSADMQAFSDGVSSALCENIKSEIEEKFTVKPKSVTAQATAENAEEIILQKVTVTFENYNKLLFEDTQKYIAEKYRCECEVE